MDNLIWQPKFCNAYDFKIYLEPEFALEMVQSRVNRDVQSRMNELADVDLKKFSINWQDPYLFHEETGLVTQICLGRNGVWLATKHQNITDLLNHTSDKLIEYDSHNVDFMNEAYTLMFLFDKWINYAHIIISMGNKFKK